MNDEPLLEKEYAYTEKALDEALSIMEKTVFKTKRMLGLTGFLVLFGGLGIVCALTGEIWGLVGIPIALAFYFMLRNSFRKEYLESNSLEADEKYLSKNKILSVYDNRIEIYAEYTNPDYVESKEDYNDPEYIELRDELNKMMGTCVYPFSKKRTRVYENESAIVVYWGRDRNNPIEKSIFSQAELDILHSIFKEKLGKRYIVIQ